MRNVLLVYERFDEWSPSKEDDLLQAHQLLMQGLVDELDRYRNSGVGVMSGQEIIHPFADGNGRMGRLWQSLILAHWNPLFAHLPVETLVHTNQAGCREQSRTSRVVLSRGIIYLKLKTG